MKLKTIALIFFLSLFFSGCQSAPQVIETPPTATPSAFEDFKSSYVFAPYSQQTVLLVNGVYEGGEGATYLLAQLDPHSAIGDLNNDGQNDYALLLSENMGGSGNFVSLIPIIRSGSDFIRRGEYFIDDRPVINSLSIVNGKIILDAVVHTPNDAMVSPSKQVMETFSLIQSGVFLSSYVSTIENSRRYIQIELPFEGQDVSGSLEVAGSMPIAPFENTLRYRLLDMNGIEIASGPFSVASADMGVPATFDNTIEVPASAAGTKLILELAELSMADGSYLCSNSIVINVK